MEWREAFGKAKRGVRQDSCLFHTPSFRLRRMRRIFRLRHSTDPGDDGDDDDGDGATATATTARKIFSKSRSRRCGRFRQIFVEIGAILAIFRPFEVFGSGRPVARTSGRPSVRTSERASVEASERAGIRARPRKDAEYSERRVLENTVMLYLTEFLE